MPNLPNQPSIMGRRRTAHQQAEQILAFDCRKPRVPVIINPCTGGDRDRRWFQMIVQRPRQFERIPILGQIAMGNLPKPMNARIGAPGGGDRVITRFQPPQRRLNRPLNRGLVFLALPSGERRAVVFNFQSVSRHDRAGNAQAALGQDPLGLCAVHAYLGSEQPVENSLVLSTLADGLVRSVENVSDSISETLFEPVIRLGVTGLARSGKTVFITSLVANLLDRGRMSGLVAAQDGRIEAAFLQPQPDDTVPRFEYETNLARITAHNPDWPVPTSAISELRVSLRVRPSGLLSGLQGTRTIHVDIVDYPGEWLLDLALLEKSYEEWAVDTLDWLASRDSAAGYLGQARGLDPEAAHDEGLAQSLTAAYTDCLRAARTEGHYRCTPGRFLMPGDLAGSPALTFAPIPTTGASKRGSLHREMARRFEAYKSRVVKPFFRDHFARIDRQIVLVDALGAIHSGPAAVDDLRVALSETLGAFRPGRAAFLSRLLGAKRVEKILFAATKADHLHHLQHPRLTAIMEALVRDARDRADFAGADTAALSLAALRATTEEMRAHNGKDLPCVRGTLLETGKPAAFYPGDLPEDPNRLLGPARDGADGWLDADYQIMKFAPAPLTLKPGDGPPHIRLDRAAQFLIGDRL